MKKFFLHMLLVSVLGMLTVSCRDEYEEAMAPESSKAQVVFSVAMDTPVSRTRAAETWGKNDDPSAPGTPFDNRIDIDQLIVKIVDGNGDEYKITDIMKWKSGDNGYKFVGVVKDVTEAITLTDAKVYVYANMGTETPAETFEQGADYIPMWGVKKVSLSFAPGKRENAGEISLLRAMAKLEVKLDDNVEMNEYKLTSAKLNKYNKKGNTHPTLPENFDKTEDLGLEAVLNVNTSEAGTELDLTKTENGSYVVYLPEVENGTSETDWLKISVTLKEKEGDGTETGSFYIMNYPPQDQNQEPVAINIVRNHWYQYTINGFAASKIQVSYNAVDWNPMNIEIGGDGFLFLNKDLIEIYNGNISEGELKFSSSSPIKSVVLTDLYTHNNNGTFVEGTADGVSAYYLSKYGQKVQLGTDPGFDITDKVAALATEKVILSNISATAEADALNGYITINSPFLADPTNAIPELQQNSHYDTPRYLEFLVTNQQGLTATFRVMQYPPVVITNEEGYFSYRSDQKFSDDQEEASHYHNYMGWKSFHLSGLMWYQVYDWTNNPNSQDEDYFVGNVTRDYGWIPDHKPTYADARCEVVHYGNLSAPHTFVDSRPESVTYNYGGLYKSTVHPRDAFLRHRYYHYPGGQTTGIYKKGGYKINSKYYDHPRGDLQGLAVGPYYEEDGRILRKQFVWNVNPIFYNLYVSKVYDEDENNRLKGQADLNQMTYSVSMQPGVTDGTWTSWGKTGYTNHRMYIIRTTTSTSEYNVGHPTLTAEGVTENTVSNANMISPKFAVASQLGETQYQSIITNAKNAGYAVPAVGEFYKLAVDHCREYVETTYIDKDGDHEWDADETVIHYDDWRLPTKAEINAIINYQNESRAMDRLLVGQYYFCAAGGGKDADVNVKENWVSKEVAGYSSKMTGYYIRCVRDVKPEGQNGFIGK